MVTNSYENLKLVEFLEVACTNVGKETFYITESEQLAQLTSLHTNLVLSNRRYYSLTGLLPINDYSKTMILRGLLATGKNRADEDETLEWNLIKAIVDELPITRLLRFFVDEIASNNEKTGGKRLNNARVRRLGQRIWDQAKPYQVIKYKDKYKTIIRHCRLKPDSSKGEDKLELQNWLFGKLKKANHVQKCDLLKQRLLASKGDKEALMKLPLDVAEGIALAKFKMSKEEFVGAFSQKGKASRKETLRNRSYDKTKVTIDFSKYNLLELIRYGQAHHDEWGEIAPHIKTQAEKLAANLLLPQRVAIVVDNSLSMQGKKSRYGYPIAFAEAVTRICLATKFDVKVWFTQEINLHKGAFTVKGATDIRLPLAKAISSRRDAVIIISDGYENQSSGTVAEILNTDAVKNSDISFYQINPVAAVESDSATRTLASGIDLIAMADIKQFPLALMMTQMKNDPDLLINHLNRVYGALQVNDIRQAKAIARFKDSGKSLALQS